MLALALGFEPRTSDLTGRHSTLELHQNIFLGMNLCMAVGTEKCALLQFFLNLLPRFCMPQNGDGKIFLPCVVVIARVAFGIA